MPPTAFAASSSRSRPRCRASNSASTCRGWRSMAHRATIVRSMHHSVNNAHAAAVYTSLTGHDRGDNTRALGGGTGRISGHGLGAGHAASAGPTDRAARVLALHHQGRGRRPAAIRLLRRLARPGLRPAVRAQGSQRAGLCRARVDPAGRRLGRTAGGPAGAVSRHRRAVRPRTRASRPTTAWTASAAAHSAC